MLYLVTGNIPTLLFNIELESFSFISWYNERNNKTCFFVRFRPLSLDFVRPVQRDMRLALVGHLFTFLFDLPVLVFIP